VIGSDRGGGRDGHDGQEKEEPHWRFKNKDAICDRFLSAAASLHSAREPNKREKILASLSFDLIFFLLRPN
jgi:hypothetical protein